MPSIRYQIGLALTKEDYTKMQALKKKKVKVIEIFRAGLTSKAEDVKSNSQE